jgi:choline-glycine betaine transporter
MPVGGIPDPNRFICLAWGAVIGAIVFVLPLSGGLDALRQTTLLVGCRSQLIINLMCYALYKGFRANFREPLDRQEGEIAAEQSAGKTTPNLGKYPNRSHL